MRGFALGSLGAFLMLWLRPWVEPLVPEAVGCNRDLVDAFLITAVIEELLKLGAFMVGACRKGSIHRPLDGIICGAAAALGFASAENVIYLIHVDDLSLLGFRAFTSTLAHAAFTGSLCFTVGLSRLGMIRFSRLMVAGAFLAAVVFHGAYNFLLWQDAGYAPFAIVGLLPVSLLLLAHKIRWSQRHPLPSPARA